MLCLPGDQSHPVCATDSKPSCVLHLLDWFIGSRGFSSLERRPEFWVLQSSIGTFIPYDWRILIKAVLKPGEYLQWTVWFQDIARDHANRNARAGTPPNQIPFGMLTGTGKFDTIEAQIRCPSLLHDQLKTVALEAWD